MNCEVLGLSGSMTCACVPAVPGTAATFRMASAGSIPPAVNPAPMPSPRPATEICPSTKRSPPSMNRTMRSAIAPRATSPATPIAIPTTVNPYRRRIRPAAAILIDSPRPGASGPGVLRLALPLEAGFHGESGAAAVERFQTREREQQAERPPRPGRHPEERAAAQHGQHGVAHAEVVLRPEQELEERRLVVLVD